MPLSSGAKPMPLRAISWVKAPWIGGPLKRMLPARGVEVGLTTESLPRDLRARHQALEFLERHPARHREEAAVGHEGEPLGRDVLQAEPDPLGHVLGSLHVK